MSDKNDRPVQFESLLEEQFLRRLEEWPSVINYCEQPLWIPVPELGHNYCPDCLIGFDDGTQILVEIKPLWVMPLYGNQLKWNALRDFANARGIGHVMTDGKRTMRDFQEHIPPADYRSAVLDALMSGPIEWQQYDILKKRFRPSGKDMASLVFSEKLVWSLGPFRLAAPKKEVP